MSNEKSSSTGLTFGGALFLVLLVLKLIGVIGWSWWWITAPLWGGLAIVIIVLVVLFLWALWMSAKEEREK